MNALLRDLALQAGEPSHAQIARDGIAWAVAVAILGAVIVYAIARRLSHRWRSSRTDEPLPPAPSALARSFAVPAAKGVVRQFDQRRPEWEARRQLQREAVRRDDIGGAVSPFGRTNGGPRVH